MIDIHIWIFPNDVQMGIFRGTEHTSLFEFMYADNQIDWCKIFSLIKILEPRYLYISERIES